MRKPNPKKRRKRKYVFWQYPQFNWLKPGIFTWIFFRILSLSLPCHSSVTIRSQKQALSQTSAGQNLEQPRSSSGEAIVKVTAVALFLTSASLPPCHSACR